MPRRPLQPQPLTRSVFRGSTALAERLVTRDQLRSRCWRRVLFDGYADAELTVDHGLLIRAASLLLPPGAVIAGRSAAWLHGARLLRPTDAVEVAYHPARPWRGPTGVRPRAARLSSQDVLPTRPPTTTVARTCLDVARWHDPVEAVATLDALLASTGKSAAAIVQELAAAGAEERGNRRAAGTLALVDPRAESPAESRLRVHLVLAGLPPPTVQYEVRVGRRFIARTDLAWPQAKVAVEYDGRWHGDPGQLPRDRRRLNELAAAGWTVIHVTAGDLADLRRVVAQIQVALGLRRCS